MRRKPTLASLKKKLWKIFSRYIRLRDKGICFTCGKQGEIGDMDSGHYVPKTAGLAIYFDEKNVHCQCTACNRFRHGNQTLYAINLRRLYGDGILEELDAKRRKTVKWTEGTYLSMISYYEEKVKESELKYPVERILT